MVRRYGDFIPAETLHRKLLKGMRALYARAVCHGQHGIGGYQVIGNFMSWRPCLRGILLTVVSWKLIPRPSLASL
jgi:hypothetical protein